ncbi:MAG: hypothetical protein KDD82_14855, partial [Planctomycetes bacterium]|nr:hypothetical protein [Planctomycetota bacterium]
AAVWLALPLTCARAPDAPQDPPPTEEALRELRDAAAAALDDSEDAGAAGASDEERLRRAAQAAVEDESPLYQSLLDAYSSFANRLNAFNPRITVIGDALGRLSASSAELVEDGINRDDRFSLREVELDMRADIDPYSKGVLILAWEEEEPGEYTATVEEGYLTLETLPLGFRAQLGRFRVPFGRINLLHTHDLPQPVRPYALTDMFGEEGFAENGVILTWLAPKIPLELSAALLNGENGTLFAGANSDDPAWLGRAEFFQQLGPSAFFALGASFAFGYNDAPNPVNAGGAPDQESQLWGADVLLKWQSNQFQSLVVQGEVFGLKKEVAGGREHAFGGYGLVQVQPSQRWYFGARYDWSNYDEATEDRKQWAASGYVSYYTTEFLRFRLGFEHRERQTTGGGEPDLDTVFFQVTFVFGSHPVEPFWFNK